MEVLGRNKYHNAETSLAEVNSSIKTVTTALNEATAFYKQAMTAIAACDNSSIGCLDKTGRHISTWRDQRDRYAPLVDQYKKELAELLALQKELSGTASQNAEAAKASAEADEAIANADAAKGMSMAIKLALIFGGIAVVGIVAFVVWKKLKKK